MKRRRVIAWAVLGVLVLLPFFRSFFQAKEPIYQGKTVTQWIREGAVQMRTPQLAIALSSDLAVRGVVSDSLSRLPAYSAMVALGDKAVPFLLSCLDNEPAQDSVAPWRTRAYAGLYGSRFMPQWFRRQLPAPVEPGFTKRFAASALVIANLLSFEDQLPLFVKLHKDLSMRPIASLMLTDKALSSEHLELFVRKLCWEDRNHREALHIAQLLYVVGELEVKGTNLVGYFVPLLKTAPAGVRGNAIGTLQRMGRFALPALPDLMGTATNDTDLQIRFMAVKAIAAMGPAAREAVPFLLTLANSDQSVIRSLASKALQQIDPTTRMDN